MFMLNYKFLNYHLVVSDEVNQTEFIKSNTIFYIEKLKKCNFAL